MFRFLPRFCLLLLLFIVFRANAQNPTITATNGVTSFCQGGSVVLNVTADTLTSPTYQWQLNGNNIINATNSSYIATNAGTYTVISKSKYNNTNTSNGIAISVNPNATISLSGNNNQTVCLNEGISKIEYTIGGGGTGAGVSGLPPGLLGVYSGDKFTITGNPSQSNTFSYTVTTSGTCAQTSATGTITVNPLPSMTAFTFNDNACAGSTVNFANTTTGVSSYSWNFGDGNNGSGGNTSHTYASVVGSTTSNYSVVETVTDSKGCTNSTSSIVHNLQLPDAEIYDSQDLPSSQFTNCGGGNFDLQIQNTSTTSSTNKNYSITWGDLLPNYSSDNSFSFAEHIYKNQGYSNLQLTVTGNNGCVSTNIYKVYNGSNPAVGLGNPGNTVGQCVPISLNFPITGTETNPPGTVYIIKSNASPDDSVVYQNPPPSSYTQTFSTSSCGVIQGFASIPNAFYVRIVAQNPCGFTPQLVEPITTNIKPLASIQSPTDKVCVNNDVSFANTTVKGVTVDNYGRCDTTTISNWLISPSTGWNLVSSSSYLGLSNPNYNPTSWGSRVLDVNFTTPGGYTISLIVKNKCGPDTVTKTICVNPIPTASFTLNNKTGCVPLNTISITNNSTQPTCGVNTYHWSVRYYPTSGCANAPDFAYTNGTDTNSFQPQFTFKSSGNYILSLTVTSPGYPTACTSAIFSDTIIVKDKPQVNISLSSKNICTGKAILPTDSASNCSGTTTPTYAWTFPTGLPATSTLASPDSVIFPTAGNQTIQLTVKNECGSTNASLPIVINATPDIKPTRDTAVCNGTTLTIPSFASTASGSVAGTIYQWINDNSASGLAASGSGNISFTATNNTSASIISNIIVTPTNPDGCNGKADTFKITVNPTPVVPTVTSPISYCQNATPVSLSATGTAGDNLNWFSSTGNVIATPTPSTASSGTITYYVSQKDPITTCESGRATISVVVNPIPTFSATGNVTGGCGQSTGSITITGLSTTNNYDIYNGSTIVTSVSNQNSYSIASLSAGSYSIKVASNGCFSTVQSIAVSDPSSPNPPTLVSNGPITLCSGQTLTLSVSNPIAGATYTWGGSGINSSNQIGTSVSIPTVPLADSGKYTITVTNQDCKSPASTVQVNIKETPSQLVISGNQSPYCTGGSINLTASSIINTVGTVSYVWVKPDASKSTGDSLNLASAVLSNSGDYKVIASLGSCSDTSVASTVAVNQTPAITATSTVTSQCQAADGTIVISGTTLIPLNAATTYTINYTDKNGTAHSISPALNNNTLVIGGLVAGDYKNISITGNKCTSNIINTITVSDPSHPAVPIISTVNPVSVCSGKDLTLSISNVSTTDTIYTWSGPGIVATSNTGTSIKIPSIAANAGGTYTVSASSRGCTSPSASITVTVNPTPDIPTITSTSPICSGTPFTISASNLPSTGITYSWTKPTTSTAIISSETATVNSATTNDNGQYSVTATSGNCTSDRGTTTITVNPSPAITATGKTTQNCGEASGSIEISGLDDSETYSVEFNAVKRDSQHPSNGKILISNLNAGSYTNISVTTSNGCRSNVIASVTISDPSHPQTPTISTTVPTQICSGKDLSLSVKNPVSSDTSYVWSGLGIDNSNNTGNTITLYQINVGASVNVFSVYAKSKGCVSGSATVSVTVDSTPVAPTVTSPLIVCSGGPLTLNASTVSTGGGVISYAWSCSSSSYTSNQQNPTVTSTSTTAANGAYLVTATSTINGLACSSTSSTINVTVNQTPSITATGTDPKHCASADGAITINVSIDGNYTINYKDKDGNAQSLQQVSANGKLTITNLAAGTYTNISATLTDCPSNTIASVSLKDPNPPTTPIIAGLSPVCSQHSLVFSITNPNPDPSTTYSWVGQNGLTGTGSSFTISSMDMNNNGQISVIATLNNCVSTAGIAMVIVDSTPLAPSVITPVEICSGNELKLTANPISTGGGVISYVWKSSTNTNYSSTDLSPVVSSTAWTTQAGSYSVVATSTVGGHSCPSSTSEPIVVTIDSTPVISDTSHTDPSACASATGTIKFKVTDSNTVYEVGYNGGIVTSISSDANAYIIISNLKAGIYNNVYVVSPQRCTSSNTAGPFTLKDPNPPPAPIITGDSVICSQQTPLNLAITNPPASGGTYNWQDAHGNTVGSSQNLSLSSLDSNQSGLYSLIVTVSSCVSLPGTKLVRVDSTPASPSITATTNPICTGNNLTLHATTKSAGDMLYSWTGANGFSCGLQDTVIKRIFYLQRGNYTVQAISKANACKSVSTTLYIEVDSTPKITSYDSLNPANCATNTGNIGLHGLTNDSEYVVHYYYNNKDTTFTQKASGDSILISKLFAGTYSNITVTKTGCPSNAIDSVRLKDPNPPSVPLVTVDSNHVCSGTNLHFAVRDTTNIAKGTISFQWTGPNGFDSTSINPHINNINLIDSGKYSVIAIQNSCKSNPNTFTIAVDSTPTIPVIAPIPLLCSGSTLKLHATDTTSGSFNYHWIGPNGFKWSKVDAICDTSYVVNQNDSGIYKVYATSLLGLQCKSGIASDTVVVYPALTQAKITQHNDTICDFVASASNNIITLSGNLDNTRPYEFGNWTIIDSATGSHPIISDITKPNATVTFDLSGDYTLVWSIGNKANCEPTTDTMKLKVVDKPAINTRIVASNTIICQGNPVVFTVDSASTKGIINKWQYMLPYKSGIWRDTLVRSYSLSINLPDTFAVRVVLIAKDSVKCKSDIAFSDSVQIMVAPPSKAGTAFSFTADTVCISGNSGIIKDTGNIGTIVTWQQSIDGLNFSTIINSGGNSYNYAGISQTTWFRAAVKSGVCDSVFSNAVRITVMPLVTTSVAGKDEILCADSSFQLNGNTPTNIETGTWSFQAGSATTNIVNTHSATTSLTQMLPSTTYKLNWTITNGFCPASISGINIVNEGPLLNTIDTSTVTVCYGVTVTVDGGIPTGGNGTYIYQWQIMNKSDSTWSNLSGSTLQNYSFTGDTTVVLRRQVTSLPCSNTSLYKIVVVQPPLGNNLISGNSETCINTSPGLLNGSLPTGGDGNFIYQWQTSIDTTLTPWADIQGARSKDYTPPVLTITDTNYYRRKVTTQLCAGNQANYSTGFNVIVRPDAKASWAIFSTNNCAPFTVDSTVVRPVLDKATTNKYSWFVNGALYSNYPLTDSLFGTSPDNNPGIVLPFPGDSVTIKMVAISRYGCKNDSLSHLFFTPPSPKTKFKVSDSSNCGPFADTITNLTPLINQFLYHWDFGYSPTSVTTTQQPGIVVFPPNPLNKDTVYTIKLTAYNQCDTVSVSKNIKVRSKAKAIFAPAKTFGCSPLIDTFINTSRGDSTTYSWQFGDGASVLTKDSLPVTHTYHTGAQDTFMVKLIANNYCGNDTGKYAIVVAASSIKLGITVNGNELTNCNHSTVHFINTTQGASTFNWDFGDGNQAVTPQSPFNLDTITHHYDSAGTFNVTINASNNCTDTIGHTLIEVLSTPKASFVVVPDTVCIGHPINLTNTSDATTGLIWQFGDGNQSLITNPTHSYIDSGNYVVQLVAERQHTSANVCRDTAIRQVTVVPSLPGTIKASDSVSVCVPFTVTFSNTNARTSKTCSWNFGDTAIGAGNTISHTFTKVGVYTVVMNAVDTGGCTYTATKQITVNGPAGSFVYDKGTICGKVPVQFVATVTGTDSLRWNLGNGVFLTTLPNNPLSYLYPQSGKFVPSVTLLSAGGSCKVLLQGRDTVTIDRVIAGYSVNQLQECDKTTVNFIDTTRSFLGLNSWSWNFGDSKTASTEYPAHIYLATNKWPTQLVVTSKSGCSDTASAPIFVKINNTPQADIQANSSGCANQPVVYAAIVTSIDSATYYNWTFSNGTSANTSVINAYYAAAGSYSARLIVGTAYGCYDTANAPIKINPTPQVVTNPDFQLCKGQSAFVNTTGANTYEWTPSLGLNCNTCPNPIANPITTTTYIVAGYNSFGCAGRDTMLVTVIQPFVMTTSPNDTMCLGDKPLQLAAFGASNYSWSPSIGLSANNIGTPMANPPLTTHYKVIGTDNYNCFADTGYIVVAVGTYPTVSLGENLILPTGTDITLNPVFTYPTDVAGPISKYVWSPSTYLSCDTCANPVATVENDICYTLTATNIYGCSANIDTLCIKAFCKNTQVFIANAFTPDGDGINDKLIVQGKGIKVIKSFKIFSRWGQVVFERDNFPANDASYAWDGTIKGVPASPDVYIYTCTVVCDNDVSFEYKGNISIIK